MALYISTCVFLWFCMRNAISLETMAIAFSENGVNNVKLYINIVNPCSTGVQVNISAPRLPSFPMRQEYVGPKEIIVIDIDTAKFEVEGTGKSGQGILLHSNDTELIITGLSTAYNSADMYFTRNATQLGTEYVIITYCYSDGMCQFVIVAMEDNTAIEILFPQYFASSIVFDGNSYSACDVMILTLQESQTFQLQSTSDLSGVKIISPNRKRFTVISSSPLTAVQNGGGGRDQVADMVPPLTAWGNEYIIVRRNSQDYLHDDIKFVAAAGGANISIFGCGPVINHFVVPHQIYLYQMTCERVHIISDEPVLVAHFPVGFGNGDPAMLFPTPVSHYVRQYTVYIPSGFDFCAIALVMNSLEVSTFNYSDTFIPWIRIGQSMFSTAWLENLNSGVVYIEHTSPFGGHVICEKAWSMSALTIGIGNFTSHEAQDHSKTSDSSESSTMPIVHETSMFTSSEESFRSTISDTGNNATCDVISSVSRNLTHNVNTSESTGSNTTPSATFTVLETETSTINVSSNTVYDVTASETYSNASSSFLNCLCCTTSSYYPERMLEMVNELKATLVVPKEKTSIYLRKFTSSWDGRKSSAGIGVLAIVILCLVFGSVIAIDIATLFQR